jgi:CarD family transcriptional regulator
LEETAIKRVFSYMRSGDIDLRMNWKGRYKEHINLMRTGGLQDLALVLKSLFCLSRIKPLSFREKKMMEKAKELIISEISEATATSAKQVEHKILDSLNRFCREAQDRPSL